MSCNYNDFCLYCTGNKTKDIRECKDFDCPFYRFKYGDDFDEPGVCKGILHDVGILSNDKYIKAN